MNKIDFIYYKLCQKYGRESICMKKKIIEHMQMKEEDNIWVLDEYLGINLGPIEFYNIDTKEKIDLKKEAENGTFKD